jgi:hypothetical protein
LEKKKTKAIAPEKIISMLKNIGFIPTRFSDTDGVSMEANKWTEVLRKIGRSCFW